MSTYYILWVPIRHNNDNEYSRLLGDCRLKPCRRFYHNTLFFSLSLSLSIAPSARIYKSLPPTRKRCGDSIDICVLPYVCAHHTGRADYKDPKSRVEGAHERLAKSAIIPLILLSDSTLHVHPSTNTRNVTTQACAVHIYIYTCILLSYYRNDKCFRKFSPRSDVTVFTMSNHDPFWHPPNIVHIPRCQSYAYTPAHLCTHTTIQSNVMIIIFFSVLLLR